MSKPGPIERLDNLEDEVRLLDSALDARTRRLWSEIQKLQTELESFRADLAALREYIEQGAVQRREE